MTAVGISIFGQWIGVLDDSYAVGNAWFAAVLAGLITLLILIDSQVMTKSYIIIVSTILGTLGVGFLYLSAAIINIFIKLNWTRKRKKKTLIDLFNF